MENKRQVQHLVSSSRNIVRLKPRNPEEKSSSPIVVKALCDFKQDQVTFFLIMPRFRTAKHQLLDARVKSNDVVLGLNGGNTAPTQRLTSDFRLPLCLNFLHPDPTYF